MNLRGFMAFCQELGSGEVMQTINQLMGDLTAVLNEYEGSVTTAQYFIMISRDLMTAIGFLVARSVSWLRPVEFRAPFPGPAVLYLRRG